MKLILKNYRYYKEVNMRKISRHHLTDPEYTTPVVEIDMVDENGERTVLHVEGIAHHPLSKKYTTDQIQIIEFVNRLLHREKEAIMTDEEIRYLLFSTEALKPRTRDTEIVEEPLTTSMPNIFHNSIPAVSRKTTQQQTQSLPPAEPEFNQNDLIISGKDLIVEEQVERAPEAELLKDEIVAESDVSVQRVFERRLTPIKQETFDAPQIVESFGGFSIKSTFQPIQNIVTEESVTVETTQDTIEEVVESEPVNELVASTEDTVVIDINKSSKKKRRTRVG